MKLHRKLKNYYWSIPFIPESIKEKIFYKIKGYVKAEAGMSSKYDEIFLLRKYRNQVLSTPNDRDKRFYRDITDIKYRRCKSDPKLIAYYLTQFHPTPENDTWWGKGVTEWNNVSRAVPLYIGHYQPRLPGELGFYDLRLKENIVRQVELAKMYGIYAFSFYYYWFDGKRLLEKPLNLFLNDKTIDFPFCICWANESWTKGFFGSSREIIMKQNSSEESYRNFIHDVVDILKDQRCLKVQGKKVLQIYKPQDIPNCEKTVQYWRKYCMEHGVGEIYLIGCWTADRQENFIAKGFDAISEFQPGSILPHCSKINARVPFVTPKFYGAIYSYKDIVVNKIYRENFGKEKLYHSVSPMWDNTPRKNNMGSLIFDGANPSLYKTWLKDIIQDNREREDLDDNLIFVNAWNEWGEGAYLEPDRRYGYAYLQATLDAVLESREQEQGNND